MKMEVHNNSILFYKHKLNKIDNLNILYGKLT